MTYTLHLGDCLDVMRGMPANSVDTVVTDPPYGLAFMGKDWDFGVPGVAFWAEALRVAKPGAMLLAFGGTRTFHRLTCAIEDAGWEVRDCVMWLYGSGFPKSLAIDKAIDKAAGEVREVVGGISRAPFGYEDRPWKHADDACVSPITAPATDAARTWQGWGTALKPAWEPIILAMKPIDDTFANNALTWGVAGLNVDGCRVGFGDGPVCVWGAKQNTQCGNGGTMNDGWAGKPSTQSPAGRWPANLILDEDAAVALDAQSGERPSGGKKGGYGPGAADGGIWSPSGTRPCGLTHGDTGGASRFFYVAKASRAERNAGLEGIEARPSYMVENGSKTSGLNGERYDRHTEHQNHHPTVKPLALMRYLVRLTATPTGGIVLDPFTGSGTTGVACMMEGRQFIGIELDPDYLKIARRRIESVQPALVGA